MQSNLIHAARVSMLREIISSIAHEFNKPLTAINQSHDQLTRQEPGLTCMLSAEHLYFIRKFVLPIRIDYGVS